MKGALPPSSIEHLSTWSAACASSVRPVCVEPVKVSLRTFGWVQNTRPTPAESVEGRIDSTPSGIPARSASTAMARAESGVSEAGRATKPQPAASAGATLRAIMALGKFHGVIEATTPTGWRSTWIRRFGAWPGMISPLTRLASSAKNSTKEAP